MKRAATVSNTHLNAMMKMVETDQSGRAVLADTYISEDDKSVHFIWEYPEGNFVCYFVPAAEVEYRAEEDDE